MTSTTEPLLSLSKKKTVITRFPKHVQMGIFKTLHIYTNTIQKSYLRFAPNFVPVTLFQILVRLD